MNTVEVVFPDHIHTAEASSTLWQWDYGQRLIITGAPLPDSYEVHFCNAGDEGTKLQIGDMTGVNIPDEFLQTGKNILAYIYLHTGVDDGETVYKITIKVKPRARPTELFLTEVQHNALDQAIAQLEKYANATRNVDSTPVQGSRDLVMSGGVYEALLDKVDKESGKGLSSNDFTDEYKQKLDSLDETLAEVQTNLVIDSTPTENSDNPVSSGGVYEALNNIELSVDTEPIAGSDNPISSGAVATALENVQQKLTIDQMPTKNSDNPVSSGGVYKALNLKTINPDWAESDTTSPNYIKNRTHYSEELFFLEKTCSTSKPTSATSYKYFNGSRYYLIHNSTASTPCISAGDKYSVTLGEQEARLGVRGTALSNSQLTRLDLSDINLYILLERNATTSNYTLSIYAPYNTDAQTIKIYRVYEAVQKLDNKYLDLSVSVQNNDKKPVTGGAVYTAIENSKMHVDDSFNSESANPVENKAIKAALDKKQNTLTFDQTPTIGSANPVTSDGIYNALQNVKVQTDDELSSDSDNPVKNRVITAAINGLLDKIQELERKLQAHLDGLDSDGNIPIEDATIDEDGYIVFDPSSRVEVDDDGYIVLGS